MSDPLCHNSRTMNTNETQIKTTEAQIATPITEENQVHKFIELRSQGFSLGKISQLLAVPKSTLYGWNRRNRRTIDQLKRIELEALEERIIGSQQEQFAALVKMLDSLEKPLATKLADRAKYMSATELFWMAASLRNQLIRLRNQVVTTDAPDPEPQSAETRTI